VCRRGLRSANSRPPDQRQDRRGRARRENASNGRPTSTAALTCTRVLDDASIDLRSAASAETVDRSRHHWRYYR
jgi:hypothetical protein